MAYTKVKSSEPNYITQFPINPYGKAKKMAEDIILDFSKSKKADMAVMILRLVLLFIIFFKTIIYCLGY